MNEQESFWAGKFGDEYTERMIGDRLIVSNIDFFSNALKKTHDVHTILELGCNRGLNLVALEYLDQSTVKTGVDVNARALYQLSLMFDELKLDTPYVHRETIAAFEPDSTFDLVFTKGVLIHINPEQLPEIYDKMYRLSNRYILIAEYYNPSPVEVNYRGHSGKLFKRDFCSDMLNKYPLKLVDYGFVYHLDEYPQDDLHWFLMEKV